MKTRMRSLLIPTLAPLVFGASAAAAQSAAPPPPPGLAGSYSYVQESGDIVGDAIERGIRDMSFITKPIARRRLRNTNRPYRTITLLLSESEISTTYDGRAPIRSPADGTAVRWRREDGEMLDVSTSLRDGALTQTFTAEDGSRENAFILSPDGTGLTLQVTLRSERLPAPITYRLLYRRDD